MILLDVVLSHLEFLLITLNKNAHPMNVLFLSVTEFLDGKKKKKKKRKKKKKTGSGHVKQEQNLFEAYL